MRTHGSTIGESERWLSVIAGGMLVLSSLRRSDVGIGALFAAGGTALIYRGLTGREGALAALREELAGLAAPPSAAVGQRAADAADAVEEASMESFPASDPPSWTPTAGPEAGPGRETERGEGEG